PTIFWFVNGLLTQLPRRILVVLRKVRVHLIPRLHVAGEKIHRRPEPNRVIQTASSNSHETSGPVVGFSASKPRAAVSTEGALVLAAGEARREVVTQLTLREPKRPCRHQQARDESAARHALAIAAMAFEHHERRSGNFVADRSANTTARKW